MTTALVPASRSDAPDQAPPAAAVVGMAAAEAEEADGVTVQVNRGAAGLEVDARCVIRAPIAIVWDVLTDYENIDDFVSSMRESRVAGRGDHHVLVEQVAVGRLFLFKRRMRATLFVEETPRSRIRFDDVLGRDFESYHGEWRIHEREGGVEILYRVAARPSFSVPDFIARGLFKRTAGELLSQVKAEMERRARRQATPEAVPDTAGPAAGFQ